MFLVTTKFSIATGFCAVACYINSYNIIDIHSGSLASHVYVMVIIPALLTNPIITIPQLYICSYIHICMLRT